MKDLPFLTHLCWLSQFECKVHKINIFYNGFYRHGKEIALVFKHGHKVELQTL
jgi:hypothetical protein